MFNPKANNSIYKEYMCKTLKIVRLIKKPKKCYILIFLTYSVTV